MGLALSQHLLSKPDWRVVLADVRPEQYDKIKSSLPTTSTDRQLFVHTDTASWESQANLYKTAFEWSNGGRLDFVAANAGVVRVEPLAVTTVQGLDLDAEPAKPDQVTVDVNQIGVYYSLLWFIHYVRRSRRAGADANHDYKPKAVLMSSCTAIYPFPCAPVYAMTKAAVLSLTRSVGPFLYESDGIALNCLMPNYVNTQGYSDETCARFGDNWLTPYSTILRAYDELISEDGTVAQDGKSTGKDGVVKVAQSVECNVDRLYYRQIEPYSDEKAEYVMVESAKPEGEWFNTFLYPMTQYKARAAA
jgi:NAD(P)-dependent dehydrogenase (short-subunit alcohol dehydrogenase family)